MPFGGDIVLHRGPGHPLERKILGWNPILDLEIFLLKMLYNGDVHV